METKVIREKQDLTYLSWSRMRHSSGTAGSFLKAESEVSGRKVYYKLSKYDNVHGVVGHECVNELIADRLLTILGVEHLHYRLIHADIVVRETPQEVWLCASEDFKERGEDKVALDMYYEAEHLPGETAMDFCLRMGWRDYIWQMFVVDYLILNRDRHGANIEVLRNKRKRTVRLAPLFDHGVSLLFSCHGDESVGQFGVMKDLPVQSYLGSRSAWENLSLIPKAELPKLHPLQEEDRAVLFADLDGVISDRLQNAIWNMLWKRWSAYEDFCNS